MFLFVVETVFSFYDVFMIHFLGQLPLFDRDSIFATHGGVEEILLCDIEFLVPNRLDQSGTSEATFFNLSVLLILFIVLDQSLVYLLRLEVLLFGELLAHELPYEGLVEDFAGGWAFGLLLFEHSADEIFQVLTVKG